MQLKKISKKTSKIAEKAVASAPEKAAELDGSAKPRTPKSSKPKKSEGADMTSGKHLHKSALPAEPIAVHDVKRPTAPLNPETKPIRDTPTRSLRQNEIAELAYSYWLARGHHHGSADEDWFRAEQELSGR